MATELRHVSPIADAIGMAALLLLTGCLPGHTKLRGDLRPSDSLADGSVDEHRQLCLGIVSLDPDLPDLLQQLGRGQLGDSLRGARLAHGCGSRRSGRAFLDLGTGLCLDLPTSPACGSGATIVSREIRTGMAQM